MIKKYIYVISEEIEVMRENTDEGEPECSGCGDGMGEWMGDGAGVAAKAVVTAASSDRRTILLVEDNDAHAALICRIFEENSCGVAWQVNRVSCIKEALKWIETNGKPSLIIADYLLPDGNGIDLVKCGSRDDGIHDGIPLIIITAYGSERLAVHSLKSGAMDYVAKRIEDLKTLPWTAERVLREWQNIVERKKAEEELRKKNRELENFNRELEEILHIISHDLKSPLFSIRSLVHIIIEDSDKKEMVKYLKLIEKNTENMWNLVDMLIKIGKVGFMKVEYEDVCLKETIEEIKDRIKGLLIRKNAEIFLNSDVLLLKTSRLFLREILANLIVNGIIYNKNARPFVEVRCEERAEDYLFCVRDNGVGIPPEVLPEIFEFSYLLKRKHKHGGSSSEHDEYVSSGAGLPQCRKMVRRLGGEIWVKSTPGNGSTFFFTLPKNECR